MRKKKQRPIVHQLRGGKGSKTLTIPSTICHTYGYQVGDRFEIRVIDESNFQVTRVNKNIMD